jgi:ATP-binding cassette subfamily B protein
MSTIVPTVVSAIARLLSAVIALITLDWIFAVAFSVAGILVFIVVSFMRSKLKSMHKKVQETDGKTRSFMQECIENLLAVKVFAVNDKIESQAAEMQKKNFKMKMIRKNYSVLGHSTHQFIFSAGYLFALLYGGAQILNGSGLTYGALSAILQLVNNVQVPFASLSNVLPKYYSMIASAERIIEIEEIEDEPVSSYVNRDELYGKMTGIKVSGVDFSYGRDMVLTGADLFINKGDFMMIEGTSGVGKSTLMKLMLGVYPVAGGSISAVTPDGEVELGCETRPLFSYVPQGNMLFSGTLRDNVTFIMDGASESEIDRALKISCSDEFINALPDGLNTKVGESGVGLSEGQIQRIAIARAILCNSPVILLDEATSALDEDTERRVLDNLKTIDGVTLIIVSHKKAAANICNRRVSVIKGKIIDQNKA